MNWYIGQEIVCVKSHSRGYAKKGLLYRIFSLRQKKCGCGIQIDIGVKRDDLTGSGRFATSCSRCGYNQFNGSDNTAWIDENIFAPLADISELKEILEKQPETEKAWQTKKYRLQNRFL